MRRLVYYIGMTIDGFIAGPEDQVDFFPKSDDVVGFIVGHYPDALPTHVRGHLGIEGDNPNFDAVVMGRRSYEPALDIGVTSPYAHLRQYVVSQRLGDSPDPVVEVVPADPVSRVRELKTEPGRDIYLVGGGRLAGSLLDEIDALVIKLYPVVVGTGRPVFSAAFSPTMFTLRRSRALDGGTMILEYDRDAGVPR